MVIMVSSISSSRFYREGFRRPSDREDIAYQDRGQLGLLSYLRTSATCPGAPGAPDDAPDEREEQSEDARDREDSTQVLRSIAREAGQCHAGQVAYEANPEDGPYDGKYYR